MIWIEWSMDYEISTLNAFPSNWFDGCSKLMKIIVALYVCYFFSAQIVRTARKKPHLKLKRSNRILWMYKSLVIGIKMYYTGLTSIQLRIHSVNSLNTQWIPSEYINNKIIKLFYTKVSPMFLFFHLIFSKVNNNHPIED